MFLGEVSKIVSSSYPVISLHKCDYFWPSNPFREDKNSRVLFKDTSGAVGLFTLDNSAVAGETPTVTYVSSSYCDPYLQPNMGVNPSDVDASKFSPSSDNHDI